MGNGEWEWIRKNGERRTGNGEGQTKNGEWEIEIGN